MFRRLVLQRLASVEHHIMRLARSMERIGQALDRIETAQADGTAETLTVLDQLTTIVGADLAVDTATHMNQEALMAATEELLARVGEIEDTADSVEAALDGIHADLAEALAAADNVDPRIQEAVDRLGAVKGDLAAAVVRNTTAAPVDEPPADEPADPAPVDPAPADPDA